MTLTTTRRFARFDPLLRALRALAIWLPAAAAGCTPSTSTPGSSSHAPPPAASPAALGEAHPPPAPEPAPAPAPSSPAADDPLVGKKAPDFTAPAQTGAVVHLAALKGKPVILYFYPKDETPGCTKEACSFRDAWQPLAKTGAVLVGISADSLDSHRGFAEHWKLPFLLVSDPDGAIAHLFDVPFQAVHKRQTVVIGSDGTVRKVFRSVDVTVHAQEVLSELGRAT
ncbi:MAG: peroxiredoxin [Polyangiaceae bacterium]|nr:peroxiredoxin [Polyangiaceae bacterium]